jgi:hypothetical protein
MCMHVVQTKGLTKAGAGGVDRGTPYAMAPEQLDSETQHVTFKADAWAFGIMLIELFHPTHAVRVECAGNPSWLTVVSTMASWRPR